MTKMMTGSFSEEFLQRLVTRNGFSDAFWLTVRRLTAAGEKFTNREVFDEMNAAREKRFGEPMFPSYSAFHMWLKRRN